MSGVDYNGTRLRKGAGDAILRWVDARGRPGAARAAGRRSTASRREGGTPLAVARDSQVLGVIYLKDIVKEGMRAALRPAARDGHPHGHGHRRQPR